MVTTYFISSFQSETNFTRPSEFLPQRFLGDAEFANDKMDTFNPFGLGAYDCVGRT